MSFVNHKVELAKLEEEYAKTGSGVKAFKAIFSVEEFAMITREIISAITEALAMPGNTLLGSHDPWVPMAIAAISDQDAAVPELGYVDIGYAEGKLILFRSNLYLWTADCSAT